MDEKTQETAKGKSAEESKAKETPPANDDAKDRNVSETENKESGTSASGTSDPPDMIARANFAAERSEKASAELKKQNDRAEKLLTDAIASGKGLAGKPQVPQFSDKEKASRARIKAVADASGASWAKKYE